MAADFLQAKPHGCEQAAATSGKMARRRRQAMAKGAEPRRGMASEARRERAEVMR
jgi:hypothetical protein